jgi:hypothetical protein
MLTYYISILMLPPGRILGFLKRSTFCLFCRILREMELNPITDDALADVVEEEGVVVQRAQHAPRDGVDSMKFEDEDLEDDLDEDEDGGESIKGKERVGKRGRSVSTDLGAPGAKRSGRVKRTKAKKSCLNTLPLARVKRILKTDPDVKLISNDAALLVCRSTVRCRSSVWPPTHARLLIHQHHLAFFFVVAAGAAVRAVD